MGGKQSAPPGRVTAVAIKNRSGFCLHLQNLNRSASNWFWIFVANFVEALVEKCPIRQRLRQRLPTKFSAPLTFATAFSQRGGAPEPRGGFGEKKRRSSSWVTDLNQTLSGSLQAFNDHLGHTLHQFVTQMLVVLALLTQGRAVEEDGLDRRQRSRVEM